jgi:hypothetical protein
VSTLYTYPGGSPKLVVAGAENAGVCAGTPNPEQVHDGGVARQDLCCTAQAASLARSPSLGHEPSEPQQRGTPGGGVGVDSLMDGQGEGPESPSAYELPLTGEGEWEPFDLADASVPNRELMQNFLNLRVAEASPEAIDDSCAPMEAEELFMLEQEERLLEEADAEAAEDEVGLSAGQDEALGDVSRARGGAGESLLGAMLTFPFAFWCAGGHLYSVLFMLCAFPASHAGLVFTLTPVLVCRCPA